VHWKSFENGSGEKTFMDNNIKKKLNEIEIPQELRERVQLGMEQARAELEPIRGKKVWNFEKKVTYFSGYFFIMLNF
jgi:hypothetical protein